MLTHHAAAVLTAALLACVCVAPASARRDINSLRRQQQAAKKEIRETSKKISINTRETQRQLSRLTTLNGEITAKNQEIGSLNQSLDSLNSQINGLNDSIEHTTGRLDRMKADYVASLRSMQRAGGTTDAMAFIFSADGFTNAWRRVRYLREVGRWRSRRAAEMQTTVDSLTRRRMRLDTLNHHRRLGLAKLSLAQKQLMDKQKETDRLVATLRTEGASLKALLKEKEKKARALDRELDKLIAEEQRRQEEQRRLEEKKRREEARRERRQGSAATGRETGSGEPTSKPTQSKSRKEAPVSTAEADRALSGSFESNKGRLLFPVSGRYRIVRGFGRQKHPELEHVETDNSGIDVEAVGGGKARAVFEGKVSEIFKQPGYNTIIMVRHGNYLTIYANIGQISVRKGDKVKAGQTLGTIYNDPEEDGRAILHFELRKERTKLNPLLWVK